MIAGTVTDYADQIRNYLHAGITYFIGYVLDPKEVVSLRLFLDVAESL